MDTSMHGGPSTPSRKRPRESETDSQKTKREKAAERQRRKRERDRRNAGMGNAAFSSAEENQHLPLSHPTVAQHEQQQQALAAAAAVQHSIPTPQVLHQQQQAALQQQQHEQHLQQQQQQEQEQEQLEQYPPELTEEEKMRRDKVRAAARERQRKHRQLVKQRRMRDLGLDMGNEIMPGMEEVHYRAAADGQYHQVLPPELQQLTDTQHAALQEVHEPPFPQGAVLGGQTFASTLLLSFSCAPLLKSHLLRTLSMSNEELASLEPVLAEAWDRWDHQRRMQYAELLAKNGGIHPPNMPFPAYALDMPHGSNAHPPQSFPHPNGPGPTEQQAHEQAQATAAMADDFRARFHRSIVAPSPFRTSFGDSSQTATTTPSSASGSGEATTIDPHLAGGTSKSGAPNGTNGTNPNAPNGSSNNTNGSTKSEPPSPTPDFEELLTSGSF